MVGRIAVTGLGIALAIGATPVIASAASERGDRANVVDLRKAEDDVEIVLLGDDDDDGDDGDSNSGGGAPAPAPAGDTTGDADSTAAGQRGGGGDTTGDADSTAAGQRNGDTSGDFDSTAAANRRGADTDSASVSVTSGMLLINQRISQAALRRLDRVEALRRGERGDSTDDARRGGGRVTVSLAQLRINQRIAQAAVRRANRLEGRPVPPRSGTGGRLSLTSRQVRINQRIGQAAVRRANALLRAELAQRR